jgi:hypothetical protein
MGMLGTKGSKFDGVVKAVGVIGTEDDGIVPPLARYSAVGVGPS